MHTKFNMCHMQTKSNKQLTYTRLQAHSITGSQTKCGCMSECPLGPLCMDITAQIFREANSKDLKECHTHCHACYRYKVSFQPFFSCWDAPNSVYLGCSIKVLVINRCNILWYISGQYTLFYIDISTSIMSLASMSLKN